MGENSVRQLEAFHHPVVQELCDWVNAAQDRQISFAEAITTAISQGVAEMQDIHCLSDWFSFLDSLLLWVPSESIDATEIFNRFSKLYFVLDQPSVMLYQSPVAPDSSKELSFVSKWIIAFNVTFGTFMDTSASLTPDTLAKMKLTQNSASRNIYHHAAVGDLSTSPLLGISSRGIDQ